MATLTNYLYKHTDKLPTARTSQHPNSLPSSSVSDCSFNHPTVQNDAFMNSVLQQCTQFTLSYNNMN